MELVHLKFLTGCLSPLRWDGDVHLVMPRCRAAEPAKRELLLIGPPVRRGSHPRLLSARSNRSAASRLSAGMIPA